MTISTRTPEGSPNQCPICGASIRIEASRPFGDAPCPQCGCLLWFLRHSSGETRFMEHRAAGRMRDQALDLVAERLGIPRPGLEATLASGGSLAMDSLDLVEFIMELEEELDRSG